MQVNTGRPVWAEIDLGAIAHNIREIRKTVRQETEIMAVVKANGYGHGAEQIAKTVLKNGADRLGVATLGEAIQLRESGIGVSILVLGYIPPGQVEIAVDYDITQTVYTVEMAEIISQIAVQKGKVTKVHVKIDTGMGRIGFHPGPGTLAAVKKITEMPGLFVEGIFTHFAVADHADKSFTLQQFEKFTEVIRLLEQEGISIPIKHAANSAAVIDLPDTHLNMVRPGIIIYGLFPSEEVDKKKLKLIPAMTLKAQVSYVKTVPAGTSISYGRRFTTVKDAIIVSLPLGYADGFSRLLSNKAEVLIWGMRVPVAGVVCMDQFMVDATGVPEIKMGDEAVIFGRQGNDEISVEEFAGRLNTINYEVICMLSERIPRIYTNGSD